MRRPPPSIHQVSISATSTCACHLMVPLKMVCAWIVAFVSWFSPYSVLASGLKNNLAPIGGAALEPRLPVGAKCFDTVFSFWSRFGQFSVKTSAIIGVCYGNNTWRLQRLWPAASRLTLILWGKKKKSHCRWLNLFGTWKKTRCWTWTEFCLCSLSWSGHTETRPGPGDGGSALWPRGPGFRSRPQVSSLLWFQAWINAKGYDREVNRHTNRC